mmetsp:Transcript_2197/g.2524  ORF Transcript_2197/g.2524 Transcript_2197/m.2524 type:complete len:366 (+) Transcript_2197:176-1273(+)
MTCESDFDCPGTQHCFLNVSWSDVGSFCECSSWYGWTGTPDCTSFGVQAKFALSVKAIEAFIGLLLIIASFLDGYYAYHMWKKDRKKYATKLSLLYSSFGVLFHLCWSLWEIAIIATPEKNALEIANDEEKYHTYIPAKRTFLVLTVIFLILSCLHVSILWLEVAYTTKHLVVGKSTKFRTYKRIVYAIEVFHAVILSIAAVLGLFYLIVLLAFPLMIGIAISYTVGYIRLNSLIQKNLDNAAVQDPSQRAHYNRLIRSVKKTTGGVVLSVYLMILSGIVYSVLVLLDWREYSEINHISTAYFVNEVFIIALLWALVTIWIFSHESFHGFKTRSLGSSQKEAAHSPDTTTLSFAPGSKDEIDSSL